MKTLLAIATIVLLSAACVAAPAAPPSVQPIVSSAPSAKPVVGPSSAPVLAAAPSVKPSPTPRPAPVVKTTPKPVLVAPKPTPRPSVKAKATPEPTPQEIVPAEPGGPYTVDATCTSITVDTGVPSWIMIYAAPTGVVEPTADQEHIIDALAPTGVQTLTFPSGSYDYSVSITYQDTVEDTSGTTCNG